MAGQSHDPPTLPNDRLLSPGRSNEPSSVVEEPKAGSVSRMSFDAITPRSDAMRRGSLLAERNRIHQNRENGPLIPLAEPFGDGLQARARICTGTRLRNCWAISQGWFLPVAIGVCTALSGCVIELGVRKLSSLRFGFCSVSPLSEEAHCPEQSWTSWGDTVGGFLAFTVLAIIMAGTSAALVYHIAPAAAGSGIPEVKTILNGFVMYDVVSSRTLCVKVPGLVLSVAAGMALGKEGPLVHVACCWAQLLSRWFPRYASDGARQEMFSAASAAGVSTAFGAPLGGVLFSFEEVSTFFSSRTLLRCFTSAVAAAVVLQVANLTGTGSLTLFSVPFRAGVHPLELIAFVSLGVVGGLVGAIFNGLNIRWAELRTRKSFKDRVHPIAEVTFIALVTLLTSWPLAQLRPISSEVIHALFGDCGPGPYLRLKSRLGLCTEAGDYAAASSELLLKLLAAAGIRLFQMTLTFGTKCPAGLFVPSLFIGAALGRCVGVAMRAYAADIIPIAIEPGVYSMVGAGAVLGGVCRVTISLVVIMLELTGGLTYVVPFMLAVLTAKLVGDAINEGIYDLYVVLKKYPFLHEELDSTFKDKCCCDVMETGLTKIDLDMPPKPADLQDLQKLINVYRFHGYPVVRGSLFVGYIRRRDLEDMIKSFSSDHDSLMAALENKVDKFVTRMVPETPLEHAHQHFFQISSCQRIFFVGARGSTTPETLQGLLTKKDFIEYLAPGNDGCMLDPGSNVSPVGENILTRPSPVGWVNPHTSLIDVVGDRSRVIIEQPRRKTTIRCMCSEANASAPDSLSIAAGNARSRSSPVEFTTMKAPTNGNVPATKAPTNGNVPAASENMLQNPVLQPLSEIRS